MPLTPTDVTLLRAAASLAAHAPEKMQAAHLAERLEELADRIATQLPAPAATEETTIAALPMAA